MSIEIISAVITMAIATGLTAAWYLTQIQSTMVRLKEETDIAYEINQEVRTLRQLNDELTDSLFTAEGAHETINNDLDFMTAECKAWKGEAENKTEALLTVEEHYKKLQVDFADHQEASKDAIELLNQSVKTLETKLFCAKDSNENLKRGHRRLTDDKRKLSERLKAELDGRAACERKNEEHLKALSGMGMILNSAQDKVRQLTDELTETKEELRSKRLQLDRANTLNEQLHAELDDWENEDDGTDNSPNNPNFSKHPNYHKNKAQGIKRVHWHTVASACRAHFEALFMKAHNKRTISNAEIKKRFYLAQEGINTLEAGRKK